MSQIALKGFDGDLLEPGDPGYDDARRLWNVMIDKRPAFVARCRSAKDVVAVLERARAEDIEVAVRGGGHSISGLSSTDGGIMIDLQPMNGVEVDPERRRARVGGGALLRDLDRATHAHGLATTGGMVNHTGVGGLTLGGGYGWLARLHGLACDNLVSAEVVTASGDVVRASDDENTDLFWGIRGGGGNFGVVTEFEFRSHQIGPVLSVERRYEPQDAVAVLRVFRDLLAVAPRELCGLADMAAGRDGGELASGSAGTRELITWLVYVGADLEEGERLAAPLARVARPIAESARVMTYPDVQSVTSDASGVRRRHYWKGSLVWDLSDAFLDTFVERGLVGDGACGLEIFSLGGAISDVGDDDTAYPSRGAVFDSLSAATWEDPRDDDSNISTTRANWEALREFVRGGVYVNDLGADAQDRVREVYGSKFERLVALKQRWDPDNTFHLNANIRPT
ncbi:MAG TPA: FAD-binding oxidoreductase [Actinomycetota bacterium]|nr:FAD-binding oxidoreductase [Actinomycetota bacterium]